MFRRFFGLGAADYPYPWGSILATGAPPRDPHGQVSPSRRSIWVVKKNVLHHRQGMELVTGECRAITLKSSADRPTGPLSEGQSSISTFRPTESLGFNLRANRIN